jgi:hypothetical protein
MVYSSSSVYVISTSEQCSLSTEHWLYLYSSPKGNEAKQKIAICIIIWKVLGFVREELLKEMGKPEPERKRKYSQLAGA